jgi:hypothetical protein
MPSSYSNTNKSPLIDSIPSWPQYKIKSDASFGGTTYYDNINFIGYDTEYDFCGNEQKLFRLNRYSADY